ncbi:uncharacterized protein LOC143591957 [Bidens hawaiensis]|uniref:uncharacterized protein LOC143591957 n=1 Tax=Bidens hawaiensis TaxID=980011 RepID=UPI0040497B0A
MDFDTPSDLITKTQITFRTTAGLSSFNLNDTTLPSFEPSISSLNPSHIKCKFCQAKLLRGLDSLVCVYCGQYQKTDLNPDPISFNSTHGYSWLLQSLSFNGSERIGSLAEGSGINDLQSPAEDELTLSELLNLKISLENIPVKLEKNINIKTSEDNSPLNVDTTDFDNFFTKSKSVNVSDVHEEQPVARKSDQNKTFEDQSSLNLDTTDFDNYFTKSKSANASDVHKEQPVSSKADQNKIFEGQESFTSDWNAEFQFADNKSEHEKPVSVDPFDGAEADLDNFFTKSKNANLSDVHEEQPVVSKSDQNKIFENQENFTDDWNAEFQFADNKSEREKPVSVDPFKGAETDLDNFFTKSKNANLSDAHEEQPIASKSHQNKIIEDQENFTDDWNAEFQFADTKLENVKPVSVDPFESTNADLSAHMDAAFGPTATRDFKNPDNASDLFQDDLFANINEASLQDDPNNSTTDWFEDTNWQKSSTNDTDTIKDDNLFDIKPNVNDSVPPEKSNLDNSNWFQNSQLAIGGSRATTDIMANKDNGDDDGFGDWSAFTSSTANQDSVQDSIQDSVQYSWKGSGISEKMPDLNLFQSAVDSQEVDFGNFLQSEVSTGSRNANTEAGNTGEGSKNDENTLNATTGPKDDVQTLISQMHDLSFMLKDELSVPSKSDDIGTFHS